MAESRDSSNSAAGHQRGLQTTALVCAAVIGLATSLVLSAGDALFLHRVGAEHLGTAFAVSSALLVFVLAAVGARADRGGRDALVVSISLVSAVILVAAALVANLAPRLASSVVLIGGKQMAAAVELSFWVLLAERFDARQLRRALPWLIAAQGAGLAIGAGLVATLAHVIGVPALALAGALAFVVAGALARRTAKRGALRPLPRAKVAKKSSRLGIAEGARAVRSSPVASRLVVLVILAGATTPVVHYLFGLRAEAAFSDEASLASFFGAFRAAVQVVTVVAQALIAARLINRAGIGTALLVAPAVTAVSAVALIVRPELLAVVIAQAAIKLVDGALETPAQKLAQNLTAREVRGRISGFLDGVAKRAGSVVGGILAATLAPTAVTIAFGLIALAWFATTVLFRLHFPRLAVKELAARSPGSTNDEPVELDRDGLAVLRAALGRGGAGAARARALLAELDGHGVDFSAELAAAITQCDGDARRSLVRELGSRIDCGLPGAPLDRDVAALADTADDATRLLAARLGASVASDGSRDLAIATQLASLRASGTLALECFEDGALYDRELCRAVADGSLPSADEPRAVRRLLRLARACKDGARATLIALRQLCERRQRGSEQSSELAAEWLLVSSSINAAAEEFTNSDCSPPVRAAAVELWATVGGARVATELASNLGAPDRRVARAALGGLRRLGADAIEALLQAAAFGRRRSREPALEFLRELRVPAAVLDELIAREARIVAESAARLPALANLERGALLCRRVSERIAEGAHTLFLLLEARHERVAIGRAARRLRLARHQAARARAIEALDAVLPRRYASLLEVLDGDSSLARARRASRLLGHGEVSAPQAVRAEIGGDDRLARRIAIFALGDGGREEFSSDITTAALEAYSEAAPEEVAARLASLLGSSDNQRGEMSRSIESVVVLSELSLFAELSTRELAELADVVSWMTVEVGDVLMCEGDIGDAMYFVVDGSVRVERGGAGEREVIADLGRGEPFGEMALFDDEVRSATVTASERARLGRIARGAFEDIVSEVPGIGLGICRALSRRLR